jgi:phenylacetate-CoA ligase
MARTDTIYARLPRALQNLAVTGFGAYWAWQRFGPGFRGEAAGYRARDRWTAAQWDAWRREELRSMLSAAVERVPAYREAFDRSQRTAALAGRLDELPLLEKDPLREDPRQFLDPERAPRRPLVFHTSGSSGTPIATYWTVPELRGSIALREVRSAGWAGVSFRQPRATFSGRMVEPDPDSTGPYHRFNAVERQVYLSPFHLRPDTAWAYADALRQHHTVWATGYAVSYGLLARFLLDAGVEPLALSAVITTSEKLTTETRDLVSRAFGCRAFEEYSTVENALFASECESGSLHVSPDAGVVEILRPDGSPTEPGEIGEVVATSFLRRYQPLIRFRLGDLASWSDEPCACGRSMPILHEVVGRVEDVVTGPDGRQMVRFHGVFVDLDHIIEGQVVQRTLHDYVVRVVAPHLEPVDEQAIVDRMVQRLGSDVSITVEVVPAIERNAAGKFRAVVSELP